MRTGKFAIAGKPREIGTVSEKIHIGRYDDMKIFSKSFKLG